MEIVVDLPKLNSRRMEVLSVQTELLLQQGVVGGEWA